MLLESCKYGAFRQGIPKLLSIFGHGLSYDDAVHLLAGNISTTAHCSPSLPPRWSATFRQKVLESVVGPASARDPIKLDYFR